MCSSGTQSIKYILDTSLYPPSEIFPVDSVAKRRLFNAARSNLLSTSPIDIYSKQSHITTEEWKSWRSERRKPEEVDGAGRWRMKDGNEEFQEKRPHSTKSPKRLLHQRKQANI